MADCTGLLAYTQQHVADLDFDRACRLLECEGFLEMGRRGNQRWYTHLRLRKSLNVQNVAGLVKPYQAEMLIDLVLEARGLR